MARYLNPQEGTEQRFCKERVHPEVRRLITFLCAIFHKKGYSFYWRMVPLSKLLLMHHIPYSFKNLKRLKKLPLSSSASASRPLQGGNPGTKNVV